MSIATLPDVQKRPNRWVDPDARYEIIDGIEVEMPFMSVYSAEVGSRLFLKLGVFLETTDLGKPQHETLFHLALPRDRNRIPDVAFTSYERWPKDRPFPCRGQARDVVPDLAVEVISPGDLVEELSTKLGEYFQAGVRLVWVVHCNLKQVHVYRSMTTAIRVLTDADELEGEDVLPGFRVPVASLFPPSIDD